MDALLGSLQAHLCYAVHLSHESLVCFLHADAENIRHFLPRERPGHLRETYHNHADGEVRVGVCSLLASQRIDMSERVG